jgi:hypothetical protein
MAETAGRENVARRTSFRKSLAEAGLPQEYLDKLEQKRKQLDESIHKYIAAKERDYRQFEKDLRSQLKAQTQTDAADAQQRRRASAEEAQKTADKSALSAVDTLLRKGSRRDSDNNAIEGDDGSSSALVSATTAASLNDRRSSDDRKEFAGVFTPQFLPALETSEDEKARTMARTASAPDMVAADKDSKAVEDAMQRANSDSVVLMPQAHAKRPAHLKLSQRTSSSGSSVDGKLVSAMKSSSDQHRPKRKRVSLAVGDTIVAPSDNVPLMMTISNLPSHSRKRTTPPSSQGSSPNSGSPVQASQEFVLTTDLNKPNGTNGSQIGGLKALHEQQTNAKRSQPAPQASPSKFPGDDIGEFWHMEEPDETETEKFPSFNNDDEFEEDIGTGIAGRVSHTPSPKLLEPQEAADENDLYTAEVPTEPEPEDENEHLEFRPESVNASQQPTNPGFRRPSVIRDPGYTGKDYSRAATTAEETGIYGSSYVRPVTKGSFTAGSLGESYMARHAEGMLRSRMAKQDAKAQ